MKLSRILALLFILLVQAMVPTTVFAQQSQNVYLFGELDPVPIRYSGCWGYTDVNLNEYALLGANTGLSVISIDDSLNIQELDFVPGPASNWREITVVGDYAYVTTEGNAPGTGLQVIDLSYLPDSVHLIQTYDSTFSTGHIIQKDASGGSQFIFVMGTSTGTGVHFLDISDPENPVEVGQYNPYYIHDCHVRGDTMFACAIYNGTVDIVDISNKSNPVLLEQIIYQNPFTHSCWTSDDKDFLIVCDEIDGLPARIWNIEDFSNIFEVAQYTANTASLVHNPYALGDHVFLSHNTEGLRIIDWAKKDVPVEVGYYDTFSGPSGGFNGLWSAYPYFPSGKIIGGNREDGLKVWKFNNVLAGRIYGHVTDSITGNDISGSAVIITQTGKTTTSNFDGDFKFGEIPSDATGYTIQVSAGGYYTKTINNVVLNAGDSIFLDVRLATMSSAIQNQGNNKHRLLLYPNPASRQLTIKLSSSDKAAFGVIDILNTDGKIVKEFFMDDNQQIVDVSDLPSGRYFAHFHFGSSGLAIEAFEVIK